MTDGLVSHKWNYSPVLFLLSQRALHTHCISSVNNTLPHTHWTKVESLSFLCEHSRRKLSDPVGHLFRDCRSPGGYFKPAVNLQRNDYCSESGSLFGYNHIQIYTAYAAEYRVDQLILYGLQLVPN